MARIRSIHPGMMTDEAYMALSFAARLLLAGVWIESDDHGVFAWKPLTLKARVFPADNVDMNALLGELITHQWVQKFHAEGKDYGVCRNFRKWQRPKSPTYQHPFPQEFGTYVGLTETSSPDLPQEGGKVPAEGGGRREDGEKEGKKVSGPSAQEVSALLSKTGDKIAGRVLPDRPKSEIRDLWKGKILKEARAVMPEPSYLEFAEALAKDDPWAQRKADEIDALMRARPPPRTQPRAHAR